MKSKLNDAELIAEAYAKVEVQQEGLGALAGGIGRGIAAAGRGLKKVAQSDTTKKIVRGAGNLAADIGKEAAIVAAEVGGEGIKAAGKAAGSLADKAIDAADRGISKLAGDEEDPAEDGEGKYPAEDSSCMSDEESCGYDQVSEPVLQVNPVDESEMHVALADLHKALKYSTALTELLGQVGELEGWTAVKIAKAADYLGAVYDKLDYDINGHSVHNTGYEDAPAEDNQ
jgi:hypothetical protein